ncbi:MAG: substrate-binding domain-containing protein [Lentisphaeria bacterium]|nr:substrate-binding domain-containing protein [Lentisphaeria bacterium]
MPIILTQTKHYQTTMQLREFILGLEAGDTVPVVSELTEILQCSHGTAIRALKALSDEGLINRPPRKQRYIVAKHAERSAARIAMVRPDFPSPTYENQLRRIFGAGKKKNWSFSYFSYRNADELDFNRIAADCDGLVMIPASEDIPAELVGRMLEMGKPVVVLMEHLDHPQISNVTADDEAVGRLAAQTLFEHNYKRILLIKDQPDESTMQLRLAGFRKEAERLGLALPDELFLDTGVCSFEFFGNKLYEKFDEFLRKDIPFDAVFCLTMDAALVVHRALLASGRKIPEEVGLLAFSGENNIAEYFTPAITTISIDLNSGMEEAVNILAERLENTDTAARSFAMRPIIEERESLKK